MKVSVAVPRILTAPQVELRNRRARCTPRGCENGRVRDWLHRAHGGSEPAAGTPRDATAARLPASSQIVAHHRVRSMRDRVPYPYRCVDSLVRQTGDRQCG